MTKPQKLTTFIAGVIVSAILIIGTWCLLVATRFMHDSSIFVGLLIYIVLPLSIPAFILVLMRFFGFRSHPSLLRYTTYGYLSFVIVAISYVLIWNMYMYMLSSEQWPVWDHESQLVDLAKHDPNFDPNDVRTAEELKTEWFYALPKDINTLKIISLEHYDDEPTSGEMLYEYNSPNLYIELDKILEFRNVNESILRIKYGTPPNIRIYFLQGDEFCETQWYYHNGSSGDFFPHGLLTWESKNRLHRWFVRKGFHGFNEMREKYNRENDKIVGH